MNGTYTLALIVRAHEHEAARRAVEAMGGVEAVRRSIALCDAALAYSREHQRLMDARDWPAARELTRRFREEWGIKDADPSRYTAELLPNGLVRVFDRASKSVGLYDDDGRHVSGDLRLEPHVVRALVALAAVRGGR